MVIFHLSTGPSDANSGRAREPRAARAAAAREDARGKRASAPNNTHLREGERPRRRMKETRRECDIITLSLRSLSLPSLPPSSLLLLLSLVAYGTAFPAPRRLRGGRSVWTTGVAAFAMYRLTLDLLRHENEAVIKWNMSRKLRACRLPPSVPVLAEPTVRLETKGAVLYSHRAAWPHGLR